MTKEQVQTIVIAFLKSQLRLAFLYIRNHIHRTDPCFDNAFMLRFADACERVHTSASNDNVIERYKLLRQLEMHCFPYLNYLHATNEHDPYLENKMRETVAKLYAQKYPDTPTDGIAWLAPPETNQETTQ